MKLRACAVALILFAACGASQVADAQAAAARQSTSSAQLPSDVARAGSLGDLIRTSTDHTVHIIYIHGIGQVGTNTSEGFRVALCKRLTGCDPAQTKSDLGVIKQAGGQFEQAAPTAPLDYQGSPIWPSDKPDMWKASRPFVVSYRLSHPGFHDVIVHEFDWWPLVLPLKCRYIVAREAYLAGPDREMIQLCNGKGLDVKAWPSNQVRYHWIDDGTAQILMSKPSPAPRLNRGLKQTLMDWYFSDPIMAVGPIGDLLRDALREMLLIAADDSMSGMASSGRTGVKDGQDNHQPYVVVSHSLGSFLIFSTLRDTNFASECAQLTVSSASASKSTPTAASMPNEKAASATCSVLGRTAIAYFLANQVELLDQAALDTAQDIQAWQQLRQQLGGDAYITAFSDPADLLTWDFPQFTHESSQGPKTVVQNCHVKNTFWRILVANPERAHINYVLNKRVLDIMMNPSSSSSSVCASALPAHTEHEGASASQP
jgi:hypothetical protein